MKETRPCGAGETCRTNVSGFGSDALCTGDGAACSASFEEGHCVGEKLETCQFHYLTTSTCQGGLTCQTAPNGFGFCGVAAECSPWKDAASCDANTGVLRVCALGKWSDVNCSALGFGGCVAATIDQPPMCR